MKTPEELRVALATLPIPPTAAVVLGSGLGQHLGNFVREVSVPFSELPDLASPTVAGHRGCLSAGDWNGRRVLVFEGRLHHYEGHSWERIVEPVRLACALGVRVLLLTNAAGGIRDDLLPGTLLAIRDHLDWTRPYCWKLPARPSPYSERLLALLQRAAGTLGLRLSRGVYAAVTGPSYETPAEIRALRHCGADAVGMSTAREVEAARNLGMECAAVSLITNRAAGLGSGTLDHEEVLAVAARQGLQLLALIQEFLRCLS
jgi:purine-nucleoside phosphorylase